MLNFYKTIFYLFFVFYFFLKSPTYPTPAFLSSSHSIVKIISKFIDLFAVIAYNIAERV